MKVGVLRSSTNYIKKPKKIIVLELGVARTRPISNINSVKDEDKNKN